MDQNLPRGQVAATMERILYEVKKVVVGQDHFLERVLVATLAQGHLLVEGVPGLAKTLTVKTLAATVRGTFKRIQFTPDLVPADLIGTRIYNQKSGDFSISLGPVFANLLLADEINRASPKTQSALLEAMEEGQVSVDGLSRPLPQPFFVIATQNPLHQVGTFPLPESQLDRFLMCISLGYPDRAAERALLAGAPRRDLLKQLRPVGRPADLLAAQETVKRVHASSALLDYVQALLAHTRGSGKYAEGLSPRAGLALLAAARAWAWLDGRDHVIPEDIQNVLPAVAGHRLHAATREGGRALHGRELVAQLIAAVKVP
ncbi:MAG: AAA family ATPase [Burkholderiaceae bacterium]|nr:AAA family ATPase [Burkholderiaceae bacterium]